jgi:acetyl coenzyme A synthetase (ADP forming)-like protein
MTADLDLFFQPKSVAVVGASADDAKVGYALLRNLLFGRMRGEDDRQRGFPGPIYAVNPKGGEIQGQRAYKSLSEIGEPIDLIVVAIPPKYIVGLMDEAAEAGVKHAIIISAGFAEMGEEGKALQAQLLERAQANGIRLVGPNCLGIIRPSAQLNASFAESSPPPGRIGLLSQSGALITGVISYADRERFGLSAAVSLGSKADVEDEDILRWYAEDDETGAVALYVEAFTEPRAFFDAAKSLAAVKPVVAIKGGTTAEGAKAASSHTGSLAGSMAAYGAAFAQAGVLQAKDISEFIGWSRALASQPVAKGDRLAIITNAGGPGVLSADAADRYGISLAHLSEETIQKLNEVLPSVWSHNNPVDVIGDATPDRYRDALNILGVAPEVDGIVVIMTVQAMTNPLETAQAIIAAHDDAGWTKPLCCSFIGLIGTEAGSYLDARGVPEFNLPEDAVGAMSALMRRGRWLARTDPPAVSLPRHPAPDIDAAREILAGAQKAGQTNLDLALATQVLQRAGLRYNQSATAADEEGAVLEAEQIGYPVVIKLISPDVVHKSDVGGVVLNVIDGAGVRDACASIRERVESHQPGARITGFTIEEQISGTEVIVGMSRDPDFGPLMMVGMGGVFVEVYEDVAFRLVPMTRRDALDMIDEVRAQALLDGARGRPVLDRSELAEVVMRVGALVEAAPEIEELDLNPLVITDDGLVAIDARVVVRTAP